MVHMEPRIGGPKGIETALDGLATAFLFANAAGRCQHLNLAGQTLLSTSLRRARGQSLARLLPHEALTKAVEQAWEGRSITLRELAIHRPADRQPLIIHCTV